MKKNQFIKKLGNFWYHYKTHVFIGILIIVAIVPPLLISGKAEKPSALNVVFIGNSIGENEQKSLQDAATANILKSGSKAEIKVQFWAVNGDLSSPANIDLIQKLFAQISSKDIDVLAVNHKDFLSLLHKGAFLDLDHDQNLKKTLLDQNMMTVKNGDREGSYGIELNENSLLSHEGFKTDDKVFGILSNTPHKETADKFVQWLIKQNKWS